MTRILKFVVYPGITEIVTATPPRFLAVGTQAETVVAWCEAEVGTGHTTRLGTVMTGQSPPADGEYIGTTTVGPIVVHVYRQLP